MIQEANKYLIKLKDSSEHQKFELLREKLTKHCKYFFQTRSKTLLIYDKTLIYIISKEETRIIDLGKQHPIIQLTYNPIKNILLFLNHDGNLYAHFVNNKTQFVVKKDMKKQSMFGWIYGRENIDLFIAEHKQIRLMRVEEEKKSIKETKSLSGKYNSFLFEPNTQTLVCFPVGDCKNVNTFLFEDDSKSKNWFKGPDVPINFQNDENLKAHVKKHKSLGLHSSFINYELFNKRNTEDLEADVIQLNYKCYLIFYYCNQGKLKLNPVSQQPQKQVVIKLPSDCLPAYNVVDNMLVIHMNNQKITFVYDIHNQTSQMLVSPFPVEHTSRSINPYIGIFRGTRHIMPDGTTSKWIIHIPSIFYYLKNDLQIFDFLLRRQKGKADLLKWLREKIMFLKHINLSKFWKLIFIKHQSTHHKESDIITLSDLATQIFNPLLNDDLTDKQALLNVIIQCIRQAKDQQIKIALQIQKLLFQLLLICKRYQTLVFMCHYDIIKDNQQCVQILMRKAKQQNEQILLTLSIDMANRVCKPEKVFQLLILSQHIWEARRYLKQNYESIEVMSMIYTAKGIKNESIRRQFLKLTRAFIMRKFPTMNEKYLNEIEEKIYKEEEKKKMGTISQKIDEK